jgi:hypothetical protein
VFFLLPREVTNQLNGRAGNDVVPSLSIGLIRDFRNVTYNLWREPGIAETVIGKVLGIIPGVPGPTRDEAEELWCWALLKTLRADMDAEKLYPPGRVFWINARTEYMTVSPSTYQAPATSNKAHSATVSESSTTVPPTASQLFDSPPPPSAANLASGKTPSSQLMTLHLVEDVELAFSEFTFSSSMFTDHAPNNYEYAMQMLAQSASEEHSVS